jgi:hypothetical protein
VGANPTRDAREINSAVRVSDLHSEGHWFESDISHITMNTYYISLTVITVIVYILWQDPNMPRFIDLMYQLVKTNTILFFMGIKMKRQLDRDYNDMQKAMKEWMKENGKDKM